MKSFIYSLVVLTLLTGCTTSRHQVTGTLRPPVTPDQVNVYYAMPENSRVIGTVSVVSYAGLTLQNARNYAMERIRLDSGNLGANGIVIHIRDDEALCGARLRGNAVFVSP